MIGLSWKLGLLLCFFGAFMILDTESIVCYDCNSENDPRCGDPFVSHSIGKINCSYRKPPKHMEEAKPTLCRKIVQTIYGKTRVTRGCGYLKDNERDDKTCLTRSGTHDVFVTYCSCTGDLCNRTNSMIKFNFAHVLCVLLAFIVIMNVR